MEQPLAWRPATTTDAPDIAALVQAAYRGPGGWTNEIAVVAGERIGPAQARVAIEDPDAVIVLVHDPDSRHLIGCCQVSAGVDRVAHLGLFAVDPRRQARGLGRRLVELSRGLAVDRFDAHTLEISVVSGQDALLGWYVRLGFVPTGEWRRFGDDPGDRPLIPGLHFVVMQAVLHRGPAALSWSGGKDSMLALAALRAGGGEDPLALLSTLQAGRVSGHGVRGELLRAQAQALGIALVEIPVPAGASNAVYEERLDRALGTPPLDGAHELIFGDLFLADIRAYREARCVAAGRVARFPLWHHVTLALARRFIADGFHAQVVCVDTAVLDPSFVGRDFDGSWLAELPTGVDPCGENGEFHTFVTDGPGFAEPVAVATGDVVVRDGFAFADLRAR
jgi:uncharacterized protein (TIGR00290 family)